MVDASKLAPFIVDLRTGRKPYQPVTVVLAATGAVGDRQEIVGDFRFIALNTATDNTAVEISWDGGQNYGTFPAGITIANFFGTSFWVKNTSGSQNTLVIFKGEGSYTDNRILLSALSAIPTSLAAGSVVAGAFLTGAVVDLGLKADSAATTDTGTFSLIALVKRALQGVTTLIAQTVGIGAAADTAATTDGGAFSLISLFKRLLGKLPALTNSVATLDAAATTNATSVKASAGQVFSIDILNKSAAAVYVRMYDKATAPTVGTDVAFRVYAVPTISSAHISFDRGDTYATGIAFAITTGIAYNDTTAVGAAHDVQLAINYQ